MHPQPPPALPGPPGKGGLSEGEAKQAECFQKEWTHRDAGCADGRHTKQAQAGGAICRDLAKLSTDQCLENTPLDSKSCFREEEEQNLPSSSFPWGPRVTDAGEGEGKNVKQDFAGSAHLKLSDQISKYRHDAHCTAQE